MRVTNPSKYHIIAEEIAIKTENEGLNPWSVDVFTEKLYDKASARQTLEHFSMYSRSKKARILLSLIYNSPHGTDRIPDETFELVERCRSHCLKNPSISPRHSPSLMELLHKSDSIIASPQSSTDKTETQAFNVKHDLQLKNKTISQGLTRNLDPDENKLTLREDRNRQLYSDSQTTVGETMVQWAADVVHQILVFRGPLWPLETDMHMFTQRLLDMYGTYKEQGGATKNNTTSTSLKRDSGNIFQRKRSHSRDEKDTNQGFVATYGGCPEIRNVISSSPFCVSKLAEGEPLTEETDLLQKQVFEHVRRRDTDHCACCYQCIQEVIDHCHFRNAQM